MIEIRAIDTEHREDINIPNEPFELWGRMVPSYTDRKWSYTIERSDPRDVSEMCFPDENYNYAEMSGDTVFLGAYDGEKCVGLSVLREGFFKYMYLYDLKVSREYRRQGAAGKLIEKSKEIALQNGYSGIYTQGQDNNLSACLFYIKSGFRIGGLDTEVYKGTAQEGKSDIIFYLDIQRIGS